MILPNPTVGQVLELKISRLEARIAELEAALREIADASGPYLIAGQMARAALEAKP